AGKLAPDILTYLLFRPGSLPQSDFVNFAVKPIGSTCAQNEPLLWTDGKGGPRIGVSSDQSAIEKEPHSVCAQDERRMMPVARLHQVRTWNLARRNNLKIVQK